MVFGIIFIVLFSITIVKGDPNLIVFKNVNGIDLPPITSIIIVRSGSNFTLTCKIIDGFDNEVVWSKKTKDIRFQEINESSKLSFTPILVRNGGTYICRNFKYKLMTAVPVLVRPFKSDRRKRAQFDYGSGMWNQKTAPTDTPMIDWSYKWKAFLDRIDNENRPPWIKENTGGGLLGLDWDNYNWDNWPGSGRHDSNWHTSNIAAGKLPSFTFDDSFKDIDKVKFDNNKPNVPISKNEYGILYCIAIIGGLLLFGGIMCMCVRNNPNLRTQLDRSTPAQPACIHAMCVRHRDTNPSAGCILGTINPTGHIPTPIVHTDEDGDVTILTFPNETIGSSQSRNNNRDVEDGPPSYAITLFNSKDDLPPSYDEVLASMNPPNYSNVASPTTTVEDASITMPPDIVIDDVAMTPMSNS